MTVAAPAAAGAATEGRPLAGASSSLGGRWKRAPMLAVGAGVVVVAVALALVPPDKTLGDGVRLVFFHGAVTWNGIVMAGLAGVFGLGHLALRRPGPSPVWRALTLAALFWVGSLAISFPVMISSWGGVLWNEPKLLMSAEVVSTLLVAWAVSLLVGRPLPTAVAAVVAAAVMAVLLVVTPGAFHPDNPIMASGDVRFMGTFAALAVGLLVIAGGVIGAGRTRAGEGGRAGEAG